MKDRYAPIDAWNELIFTLYGEEGKQQIEYFIERMELGLTHWLPKWTILIGKAGTGKSTLIHIICRLFDNWTPVGVESADFGQYEGSLGICHDADIEKLRRHVTENWEYSKDYHILAATDVIYHQHLNDSRIAFDSDDIQVIRPTGFVMPVEKYERAMDEIYQGVPELKLYFREKAIMDFMERRL